MRSEFDVLIAGGGVMGSSCAYFLKAELGFEGSVAVIEPDPSYRYAASTRSASSIRLQFSTPTNIAISRYGMEFLRAPPRTLTRDAAPVEFGLVESSYLLLATEAGATALEQQVALQRSLGAPVNFHARETLAARYPWLNVTDLAAGSDCDRGEGWFDGALLLGALRAAAQDHGARYVRDRVLSLRCSGGELAGACLERAGPVDCRFLVLCAGTGTRELALSAGIDLPVVARKRSVYVFTCPERVERAPLLFDPSGLWLRPEGDKFLCGLPSEPDPDAAPDDFEVDLEEFERRYWPLLAHRVPAFEAIRLSSAWAGHYDYNLFDQNAFVGPVPGLPRLLLANGFSGHGIQQAPGVGRALAEHICEGRYRSLDLGPLSYARYLAAAPLREVNVI